MKLIICIYFNVHWVNNTPIYNINNNTPDDLDKPIQSSPIIGVGQLARPNIPAPPIPNYRQSIKQLKEKEELHNNSNYENINNNSEDVNKSIILNNEIIVTNKRLPSSPTTTNISTNSNNMSSFKSLHNLANKNIIDKCLKSASYNVSLLNLNQYNSANNNNNNNNNISPINKAVEKNQQIFNKTPTTTRLHTNNNNNNNKNSEKKFLTLQNQVNNNNKNSSNNNNNEYRIPSSRHFCGRLLSTNLTASQQTSIENNKTQDMTKPNKSISVNCLNNEQQKLQIKPQQYDKHSSYNEQKFGKSDENLKILANNENENENFKNSTLSLSKSIKDLRFYVSNSYSPSLIIKPPLSPVIVNSNTSQSQIENDKININYQYQPKQQQLVVPLVSKRSSSIDTTRCSNKTLDKAPIVRQEMEVINDSYKYPVLSAKSMPRPVPNARNVYKVELESKTNATKDNKIMNDNDEILIDCILDMKAPVSAQNRPKPPHQPAPPIPASRTMQNIKAQQQQNTMQYSSTFKPSQVYIENNENINYSLK